MASLEMVQTLIATAEIYGRTFSEPAARLFASDLAEFSEPAILKALSRCRKECKTFPSIADILSRVEDGRPGVEEAWAMLPRDESQSVVWTEEMRKAFGVARGLIESDEVAARMAFKEVYLKLTGEARMASEPVKWSPSLGHDVTHREVALREAVDKGRLTQSHVLALLPDKTPTTTEALQITGAVMSGVDVAAQLSRIRSLLETRGTYGDGKI